MKITGSRHRQLLIGNTSRRLEESDINRKTLNQVSGMHFCMMHIAQVCPSGKNTTIWPTKSQIMVNNRGNASKTFLVILQLTVQGVVSYGQVEFCCTCAHTAWAFLTILAVKWGRSASLECWDLKTGLKNIKFSGSNRHPWSNPIKVKPGFVLGTCSCELRMTKAH